MPFQIINVTNIGSPPDDPTLQLAAVINVPNSATFPPPWTCICGTASPGFGGDGGIASVGGPLVDLCDLGGFLTMAFQVRTVDVIPGQTTTGKYPQQTNDAKIAIRYLRATGKIFTIHGFNVTGKVGILGGSASGHHAVYCAIFGTQGDDKADFAIGLSPPTDFSDRTQGSGGDNGPFALKSAFYADELVTAYAALRAKSPIAGDLANANPILQWNGDDEGGGMPPGQLTLFSAAMTAAGGKGLAGYEAHMNTGVLGDDHSFEMWVAAGDGSHTVRDTSIAWAIGQGAGNQPSKVFPGGICHLLGAHQLTDFWSDLISTNPNATNRSLARAYVDYFRGRLQHKSLETAPRVYNWTGWDSAMAKAAEFGKYFTVSIAFGVGVADRVKALVAPANLIPTHTDPDVIETMPAMWDSAFQGELQNFITDFAAHCEGDGRIRGIYITGFMQVAEGHVASDPADIVLWENAAIAAGYVDRGDGLGAKSVGYREGVGIILDMWFAAFPTTPLYFTSSRPWGQEGNEDQRWVEDTMRTRYGDRAGMANSFLKARSTHSGGTPTLVTYPRTAQAIFSSVDDRFYADISGPPWPGPSWQPVWDLLEEGYLLNRQGVEVYEYDIDGSGQADKEANAAAITEQRLKLLSLVPTPPGNGDTAPGGKTKQAGRKGHLVR